MGAPPNKDSVGSSRKQRLTLLLRHARRQLQQAEVDLATMRYANGVRVDKGQKPHDLAWLVLRCHDYEQEIAELQKQITSTNSKPDGDK
jgi:hypothetical protein